MDDPKILKLSGPRTDIKGQRTSNQMNPPDALPELLLGQARAGDDAARGRLLELYRNYLQLMARTLIRQPLRVRLDASDLVKEALFKAHRDFAGFLGTTETEIVTWLRQILIRSLTDQVKRHRAGKRDLRCEEALDVLLDRSSTAVQNALMVPISSSSSIASRREQAVLLADALEKRPPDYRDVFISRNLEHIPFDQIAACMGRSSGAVRKLWTRTMLSLKRMLEEPP